MTDTDAAARPPERSTSLLRLAAAALRYKWFILGCGAVGAVIAAGVSLVAAPRYRSTLAIALEERQSGPSAGGLAALASQFGAGSFIGTRSLEFYAEVATGRDLLAQVAVDTFPVPEHPGQSRPLLEILHVPGKTRAQRIAAAVDGLRAGAVKTATDDRTGMITITVDLPYPALAAQVAARLHDHLEQFNADTRRSSASERRRFAEREFTRAQNELAATEGALRAFLEANRGGLDVPRLAYERQRLERRVRVAEDVYSNMARELQDAKIAEVRDLPVFTLVEAPEVPLQRAYPLRKRMTLLGLLLGLALGVGVVAVRAAGWSARDLDPEGYDELRSALRARR
jgi:uncharacterized protein involved in exopolysaccharide biosynthesis